MQLWHFYRVSNKDSKNLAKFCFNQSTAKTAKELVVFVTQRRSFKERANYLKSTYLKQINKQENSLDKDERKRYNYWHKLMPFLYGTYAGLVQL